MEFACLATREPTVSLGSSLDLKEQVRQAVDIVDLVGGFVQLRRQGRNYVGLCPWHDDTRPSLQVNPERQSFKCWVCDIGGDVFSFLMKIEGVTFPEALAMLADRAGIPLKPAKQTGARGAPSESSADKRILYQAMAWAEQQYHTCLVDLPEGEPGRAYLRDRRITPESIARFRLGFCPDQWDWVVRRAEGSGYSTKVLETIGLLTHGPGGSAYDRFKGRVLFSIRDPQGRPVGLGGRVLPGEGADKVAKYINSPETPLFSKSRLLYGLDAAREAIRKSRTVLVMEGYTDCIVAHQYGFQDAVAVLGTALGESHLRILKRFADRIVLVLDGDEAGQRRANEVLELFVSQQVDLRIVTLPEEKDPCDYLLRHGAEAFGQLLATKAADALEHAFQVATSGVDLQRDVHRATEALERLVSIVAKAPRQRDDTTRQSRLREEKTLQWLAARFRVEEDDIRQRVTRLRRQSRPAAPQRPENAPQSATAAKPPQRLDPWQRELLEILIQHPACLAQVRAAIAPEQLDCAACARIYEACCRLTDEGRLPAFDRLMLEFDDPAMKSLLVELDEHGRAKGSRISDPAALVEEWIKSFQKREAQKRRPAQTVALREGQLDESQAMDLVQKIVQQQQARQGISRPKDG